MWILVELAVPLLLSIILLLLCTGKKKKSKESVEPIKYQRNSVGQLSNSEEIGSGLPVAKSETTIHNSPNHIATTNNVVEEMRSHSASQSSQARELPYPPNSNDDAKHTSQRNSLDSNVQLDIVDDDQSKHQSPKGRRLPAPPPEDALKAVNEPQSYEDEDPYASVDDDDHKEEERKPDLIRLKIKTLDIKEGSGDSSFYAKVTDSNEDASLYAQVDDKEVKKTEDENSPSISLSNKANSQSGVFPTPEYASIDRDKKSIKRKPNTNESSSADVPAPPIPDRNFDDENLITSAVEVDDDTVEHNVHDEEEEKVPMYDKLCVRESLDHQRKREQVEKERREKYENLPCLNGNNESFSDLYAQIDENPPEVVYESLSQPGSADGVYPINNPNYSSIRELNGQENRDRRVVDNQTRPQRQHHYEQIEQRPST